MSESEEVLEESMANQEDAIESTGPGGHQRKAAANHCAGWVPAKEHESDK